MVLLLLLSSSCVIVHSFVCLSLLVLKFLLCFPLVHSLDCTTWLPFLLLLGRLFVCCSFFYCSFVCFSAVAHFVAVGTFVCPSLFLLFIQLFCLSLFILPLLIRLLVCRFSFRCWFICSSAVTHFLGQCSCFISSPVVALFVGVRSSACPSLLFFLLLFAGRFV